ncbi:hypothetical protein A1O1_06273 [Capronia coronata CBS 617.96]|uniref:Uncharacterized protein n=1 Tax=Capronia coronata CBS 617.96 TaxID=1182541 RepID=W9YUF5_9EURO|nr:uncharacterized protein A1O1_06273 [Capronia coronata CBS 617.96]EXJ85904.1 hypothetical protein A1O1_06273 [Capronia coronata CBS 617.96]
MPAFFPNGAFFVDWPTWARLAIILGGLLTITLITGFCVKLRNWRKNIRLEKRAAEEEAERGEVALVGRSSDDIPFGIRALLEDSEVEGVWNSRNVTPLHYNPTEQDRPVAFLQATVAPKTDSSTSFTCLYDPADIGLTAPSDRGPVVNSAVVIDPPPGTSSMKQKRKTLIISYNGPYIRSESAGTVPGKVALPLIGYTAVDSATPQAKPGSSPYKMHLRSIASQPSSGSRRFVIGSRQMGSAGYRRAETKSDCHPLERMEAHRKFHAAESGQLLPRDQRHTDLILTSPLAPSLPDGEDNDSLPARALSWPSRIEDMNLGKQQSRKALRLEGPRPVPFRAFVESLPSTKAPPSAWTQKTQAKLNANMSTSSKGSDTNSKTSTHTPKSSISSSVTSASTSRTDSISIPSTRARKINDGFEVLPAGTLAKGPSVKEFGLWPENVKAINKPNKLRKHSRSDAGSRRSSTESRRFSDESFRLPIF